MVNFKKWLTVSIVVCIMKVRKEWGERNGERDFAFYCYNIVVVDDDAI